MTQQDSTSSASRLEIAPDGTKRWYLATTRPPSFVLHREDGPAVESTDGTKQWWIKWWIKQEATSTCATDSHGTKHWKNHEGQLHREDGPAAEFADGSKYWYLNGKHHRADGPAIEYLDGSKRWYLNDKLHREDGPAIEWADGSKRWYLNDKLHREDGPAVEYTNGLKKWYLNGKLHREDGPAAEYADGSKQWWLEGVRQEEPTLKRKIEAIATKKSSIEMSTSVAELLRQGRQRDLFASARLEKQKTSWKVKAAILTGLAAIAGAVVFLV